MTWTEIKYEEYDFCMISDKYQIKRKGEQVALYYYFEASGFHRICWCDSVEDGMFKAWYLKLKNGRKNE